MRVRVGIAAVPAVALVLLVLFALRGRPGPVRESGGRTDEHPRKEGPADPVTADAPRETRGTTPPGVEKDDNGAGAIPGTERWYYEEFLRLAAADPDDFDRQASEKARSEAPLQERVALLRAAWKVRGKEALPWFAAAFAAGPGSTDELRGFVVRHLAPHARAVPEVRSFLTDSVFLDETVDPRHRAAAGRAVLRAADPGEISTLRVAIRGIADPAVADGALVGLGLNGDAAAASALAWLAANHPDERVRERAADVSRRRLAGDVGEDDED